MPEVPLQPDMVHASSGLSQYTQHSAEGLTIHAEHKYSAKLVLMGRLHILQGVGGCACGGRAGALEGG